MHVEVNGTRLWFDVDGAALVADGSAMRERPTVVLLHGGPGSFDHSYFKPDFARLAEAAQVIYLDLRGHGRSEWGDPAAWSFETCADDVRAFCDALSIAKPVVYGHSLGGFVAMLYAARHAGHPGALVLQSTFARFDLDRIVEEFRVRGGDEIAEIAGRAYGGDSASVSDEEWAPCWALFGHWVPGKLERERTIVNRELNAPGLDLMRRVRRSRPARPRRLPDARLRGRARPDHAGGRRARDRRGIARWNRSARGDRGGRPLHLARRAGSLLAAPHRLRRRALVFRARARGRDGSRLLHQVRRHQGRERRCQAQGRDRRRVLELG